MTTQTLPVDERPAGTADVEPRRRRRSRRPTAGRVLGVAAISVMALLWVLPFLWALDTSFKSETAASAVPPRWIPEDGFTLEAYRNVIATGNLPLWLFNSLVVAVVVTALTVAVCALAAYGFSRTVFRGRRWLLGLTIASIMVPPQILIVPLFYEMLALNLVDTYWGIILPQVVMPVMVFILKKFFDAVPVELEDAARVDGASRLRIFWSIVLPLSRGILAAVAIFVFISAWNNFLWPFIVTNDPGLMTMPVGLATVESAYGVQYAQDMASAVLAALPLLIVFVFFQRQIIKGVATTGLGGQ
jgi:multiple sugar transport system permease protein